MSRRLSLVALIVIFFAMGSQASVGNTGNVPTAVSQKSAFGHAGTVELGGDNCSVESYPWLNSGGPATES